MAKRKPRIGWGSLYETNGQERHAPTGTCTIDLRDQMHAEHFADASAMLRDRVLIYLAERAA